MSTWRVVIAVGALAAALAAPTSALAKARPIYRDVAYGASPAEKATVYGQNSSGATTVVLVHGGGWRLQKLATEEGSESKSLQLAGFVVVDIDYSQDSPTETAFPLETNDVLDATDWAIANAAAYGGNGANVVLLGGSAGGQLVARAAELADVAQPGAVRAVISLSGPMNFTTLVPLAESGGIKDRNYVFSIGQALGCSSSFASCSGSYETEWSPALNIPTSGCPDWLLFTSEIDTVATAQANEMLGDLDAAGCTAREEVLTTGHGFSYWSSISKTVSDYIDGE